MREIERWSDGIVLVVGGGDSWLDWARQYPDKREIFCLDRDPPPSLFSDPHSIKADVLKLESLLGDSKLEGEQIAGIYADFLLNTVGNKIGETGITAADIIENPRILSSEPFPIKVRRWFDETKQGKLNVMGGDLIKIRELIMECALEQMLRVLAIGGGIVIIDHESRIKWVQENFSRIAEINKFNVLIEDLAIDSFDFLRSGSLRNLSLNRAKIGKIILRKIGVSYPRARSEDWY